MKRVGTKLLSMVLVFIMIWTMIPTSVFAAKPEMTIRASEVSAVAGSTVVVKLDLEDNPGLAALKVKVAFSDVLTLTNVAFNEDMGGQHQMPQTMNSPVSLTWYNGTENFTDETATFATLTFKVSEDAIAGDVAELTITYNPSDVYDITETDITLNVINGSVTIQDCVPGDINGDGVTNLKDQSRLFQYLADWDVVVNEPALDTNGDGSVNLKDQSRLFQYLADWDVELFPKINKKCDHEMSAVEYKAASCTEEGNIAYWYCAKCKCFFSNESGVNKIQQADTVVAKLPHTEAPYSEPGCLDGIKCSVCGEIIKAATPVGEGTREIKYELGNGNSYIEKLVAEGKVTNPNPQYISNTEAYSLKNPKVEGYDFLGWYDLPAGNAAANVKKLTPDDGIDTLYAHWTPKIYTIQYKSNLSPIPSETYTVETGAVLDAPPKVSNYVFAGWCDDKGKMYDKDAIPVGTTGHITLTANWISERNKTVTKNTLGDPLTYEDDENGIIYFAYEIGRIENVPLSVIHDFGYLSSDGPNKSWTNTEEVTTEESMMETFSKVISEATTQSSNWTLSNGWSENTSVDKEWLEQTGMTEEEAIERGTTESGEWYTGSSYGGSKDTTSLDTTETGWSNEVKIENSTEDTENTKIASSINASIGSNSKIIKAEISASLDTESSESTTNKHGFSSGGGESETTFHTDTTVTNSNWNSSESYTSSQTSSETERVTKELSKLIAENHHYGESYIKSEDTSKTQGTQSSSSSDEEYSTSVTYSKIAVKTKSETWSTEVSTSGYYRWILAGTAHVYGVVGYDIANDAYFVSTLSVMDDETHEMQDYSYASAAYSDNQNGAISFEVPYEVAEYVAERICGSEGFGVNQATGEITAYSGVDNCVVIPEYISVGDGDVIKVTGIGSKDNKNAFAGNENIAAVVLSDYITEISEGAFMNCTSLEGVIGGSINTIRKNAFSGCSGLTEVGVSSKVTILEDEAFVGVNKLIAVPSNAAVLKAAVNSGAKSIVINLSEFANNDMSLNGLTITVPEGTEYFELNGYGKSFTGLTIISNANKTVIKKVTLTGIDNIPLTVSSPDVELNQVSLQASSIALALSAANTRLGLQSTINVTTAKCRNLELYETHSTVDGLLAVSDTLYTTNTTIVGKQYLNCSNIIKIEDGAFESTQHTCLVGFNANGGTISSADSQKTVTIGKTYGTLPTPTRTGYNFIGWFTASELGEQVTESSICTGTTTLYAHWSVKAYKVNWNTATGLTITVNRTSSPLQGAKTGALSAGATIYHGDVLRVTYSVTDGYVLDTKGKESITVVGNVTSSDVYGTVHVANYNPKWSNGTGYTVTVTRTASPYAGAATGTITSGSRVYYGDKISVTYTPATGYSISENGWVKFTTTSVSDFTNVWAKASANEYTYHVEYYSTNGTPLVERKYVTHTYGTTNTISAPAVDGYTTPAAQKVKWDQAGTKTIVFQYAPVDPGYTRNTGTLNTAATTSYSAVIEYRNRTATSIEMRVVWTDTIHAYSYNKQAYAFDAWFNGIGAGRTQTVAYYTWGDQVSYNRSATAECSWITVPVEAKSTSVVVEVQHVQTNIPGTVLLTDLTKRAWTVAIPAY